MTDEILGWNFHEDDPFYDNLAYASVRPLNALGFSGGSTVFYVRLSGNLKRKNNLDRVYGDQKTVLKKADASLLLHQFGCWCAERALVRIREAGIAVDPRSHAAIAAKRQWLAGEISTEELRNARYDADTAASEITHHTSGVVDTSGVNRLAAAIAAAHAADVDPIWANDARAAAARAAAPRRDTAPSARETEAQDKKLEEMLHELLGLSE